MKLRDLHESLTITDEHLRQAKGNKHNFLVEMSAASFLMLTTSSTSTLKDIRNNSKTTDEYNDYANSGENIIMPMLEITGGKVTGHEGRHRAGSLLRDDENATMVVSIKYRTENAAEDKKLEDKYGPWRIEYDVGIEDMPESIRGQFGRGSISKSRMAFIRHLQR
jgi:hypothetical protein